MDRMLVLGLLFGFLLGFAIALLIAGEIKTRDKKELHEHVKKGLGKLVKQMKSVENNHAVQLYAMALERWIPRNARPWPPCLWPDPLPSRRPKPRELEVVGYWVPSSGGFERPHPWPAPPSDLLAGDYTLKAKVISPDVDVPISADKFDGDAKHE